MQRSPHGAGDAGDVVHEGAEGVDCQSLLAVGAGAGGLVVDLDEQAIGAGGDGAAGEGADEACVAGGVRRVDDHRQPAAHLQQRQRRQVEREAHTVLERADAALAEDHRRVARSEDVVGSAEQLVDGAAEPALQQHRAADAAEAPQQGNVLHATGPDLQQIDGLGEGVDVTFAEHLADDGQASGPADIAQHAQAVGPRPVPAVGVRADLGDAGAQHRGAGVADGAGDAADAGVVVDAAGTGDHRQGRTSKDDAADGDGPRRSGVDGRQIRTGGSNSDGAVEAPQVFGGRSIGDDGDERRFRVDEGVDDGAVAVQPVGCPGR